MAFQVKVSTTGTLSPVVINDLGGRTFTHPVVQHILSDEYHREILRDSVDLQAALTAGYIAIEDQYDNQIEDIQNLVGNSNNAITLPFASKDQSGNSSAYLELEGKDGDPTIVAVAFPFRGTDQATPLKIKLKTQYPTTENDQDNGTHDGANDASILSDSGQAWTIDEWVGYGIYNSTDGSFGEIISNTATTITATLIQGTDNDWDNGDTYEIVLGYDLEIRDSSNGDAIIAGGHGIYNLNETEFDVGTMTNLPPGEAVLEVWVTFKYTQDRTLQIWYLTMQF